MASLAWAHHRYEFDKECTVLAADLLTLGVPTRQIRSDVYK